LIVDAHTHIMSQVHGQIGAGPTRSLPYGNVQVGDGRIERLLPPQCPTTRFPPEVLLEYMDWVGVDKAVLLQGPYYGEANEYVWQAVKRWPDRFIGAGYVDPRSSDAKDTFRRITDEFGFRGVKFEMSKEAGLTGLYPDFRIDEGSMAWIWEAAESRNLVVTLDLGAVGSRAYQTQAAQTILERHPRLKIVIAHLAQPPFTRSGDEQSDRLWQDQILLGRHPHVWFDLSALPAFAVDDDYPYISVRQYVRRAVEMIGAEKILWGSDMPGLLSYATYPQLLNLVARHCDFLSPDELKSVLGGNAWRVYGGADQLA
jgi:predicted TIM-barrel fold metal-dependent hydrolase